MGAHMNGHVQAVGQRFLANFARFFLDVRTLVFRTNIGANELRRTNVALEHKSFRMDSHVVGKMALLGERMRTDFASKRFHARMGFRVRGQMFLSGERLRTHRTPKRFFTSVDSRVRDQIMFLVAILPAELAIIRHSFYMRFEVFGQIAALVELFLAIIALVGIFHRVYAHMFFQLAVFKKRFCTKFTS